MRRIVLGLLMVTAMLASAAPAEAFHGRHGCYRGWGGGYGYRGCGWGGYGGYGWGGGCWGNTYSTFSIGIRPYGGCYAPAYYYSCYAPCYSYGGYGLGGYYGATYYNPQANYLAYQLPAVYQPAEIAYGPQAVKQFLGLDRNFALGPLRQPAAKVVVTAPRLATKPVVRTSSPEFRAKAEQYISQGDVLFREQKYHSAVQKYKLAAETAPDLGEAYWRQGHALAASNRYDLAAVCFKRALAIDADIRRGSFHLDELYGDAAIAKQSHLEALAADALERSSSADPYFVLGIFLQYDGQGDRAAKFFAHAAELAGTDVAHIAAFVPEVSKRPATVAVTARDLEI